MDLSLATGLTGVCALGVQYVVPFLGRCLFRFRFDSFVNKR